MKLKNNLKDNSIQVLDRVDNSINAFVGITGVPVTYYSNKGYVLREYGSQKKICKFLNIYTDESSVCNKNLMSAINTAIKLGEPYFFVCSAGFVKIAIPLLENSKENGCFLAGPIIMEKFNQRVISKVISLNSKYDSSDSKKSSQQNAEYLSRVMTILREAYIYTTKEVSNLAILLNNSIVANFPERSAYETLKKQNREQEQIGETLHYLKSMGGESKYPLTAQKQILQYIHENNVEEARTSMAAYLNGIILYESGNLSSIKAHLIELCVLISREYGTSFQDDPLDKGIEYINALNDAKTIQDLSEWAKILVDNYSKVHISQIYNGNSSLILKAIELISKDLKITLKEISTILHINQSYFSVLFKREMDMTFTDYLTFSKVNKGKYLIENTDLKLADISQQSGFEDQSYFTKIFKKTVGLSPKEYKQKKRIEKEINL